MGGGEIGFQLKGGEDKGRETHKNRGQTGNRSQQPNGRGEARKVI